jgi:hypothetical protein
MVSRPDQKPNVKDKGAAVVNGGMLAKASSEARERHRLGGM